MKVERCEVLVDKAARLFNEAGAAVDGPCGGDMTRQVEDFGWKPDGMGGVLLYADRICKT